MTDWVALVSQNNAMASPQTAAQTDLLQQEAAGAAIRNRTAALQLQYLQQLPAALSAADSASGVQPPGQGAEAPAGPEWNVNGGGLMQHLQARYAPLPNAWDPGELQAAQMAALSGNQAALQYIQTRHEARLQTINSERSAAAQRAYNDLFAVSTAPDGRALDALSLVEPQQAERLRQVGATDGQVRDWAGQLASGLHIAAHLPVEYRADGTAIDATSKQEIPGYGAHVGLSSEQIAQLAKASTENVDSYQNGAAAKVPRWQAEGADSADDWVRQHVEAAQGLKYGGPTAALGPMSAGPPALSGGPPRGAPMPPRAPAPSAPPAPPLDPVMRQALSDTSYRLQGQSYRPGVAATPAQVDQQKATVAARTSLMQDSQDATSAASQSLQYLQAAKAIMATQGKSPPSGLSAPLQAIVSRAADALGIGGDYATRYQELAKYLGNSALQSAKQQYGARMTQGEVRLSLEELNPSTKMTDTAVNNLLDTNIRNAQYSIVSARRVRPYLAAGNDPQSFSEWNQQYFPRESVVNGPGQPRGAASPGAKAPPPVGTVSKGYRFMGGDPSKPSSWQRVQ